ncbi:inorganic phosphate transporter [Nocardioides insulae]|uniref:inorganic phosphate transporter n=1 Tax=Nocardioides insulae TaxID=394734 RepID=UPI00040766DE|nr:inorganic phosphate transporter [Nocardioides insulae]
MDLVLISVIFVVFLALLFDFTNGFHDAANAVATTVATKALPGRVAVLYAAVFNFLPAIVGVTLVASTIANTVDVDALAPVGEGAVPLGVRVTFAALVAAVAWNYFTWWLGLPSSSSHALIGGLVGAGLAAGGPEVISWREVTIIVVAIFASPAIAGTVAWLAFRLIRLVQRRGGLEDDHEVFRWGQILSAGAVSWGHGSNDAQKTMGLVAATLGAAGYLSPESGGDYVPPVWVVLAAATMISIGTYWGGWAIIDTMGFKITRLTRASGFAANVGAITAIFGASNQGVPISTTHAAASSIVGAGMSSRRRINWLVMRDMAIAWFVTLPVVGGLGYLTYFVTTLPTNAAWITGIGLMLSLFVWAGWLMTRAEGHAEVAEEADRAERENHGPQPEFVPLAGPAGHVPGRITAQLRAVEGSGAEEEEAAFRRGPAGHVPRHRTMDPRNGAEDRAGVDGAGGEGTPGTGP